MLKIFDPEGHYKLRFALDAQEQIQSWLGAVPYTKAVEYAIVIDDPIFGKALEFPCSTEGTLETLLFGEE